MPLLDLPEDVLSLILLYLQPNDYLSFSRTSKDVYNTYMHAPMYWRTMAATTFRLPISPLLSADGPRWYWLYKKLKTQTRLYTWGQGLKGNLGMGRSLRPPPRGFQGRYAAHGPPRHITFQRVSSPWPTEVHVPDEVGVIADLQCGGWSTTILSSDGKLFTVGALDSMNGLTIGETADHFHKLDYLTQSTSAIRQFSSGRRHILALSDHGEILTWDRVNAQGLKVFSKHGRTFGGVPVRVAAGWDTSSAYIPETGIVYWTPLKNDQPDDMLDGIHVDETVVEGTAPRQAEGEVLSVVKHIVLMDFVVWITSDSKLCACRIGTDASFEIPGFAAEGRELKDLQGQYQKFGVFTADGQVLAGNVDYLHRCHASFSNDSAAYISGNWSMLTTLVSHRPPDVPSLQYTSVIELAYGDHHYHALHADGTITSYGRDSQCCGQLGLGSPEAGASFRGLHRLPVNMSRDGLLYPVAEQRGRQVWFEPEKKDWLYWMHETWSNFDSADKSMLTDDNNAVLFSEWVEQEGRSWRDESSQSPVTTAADGARNSSGKYEGLNAYFAISIAAAGWHSGALVLVDDEKAHQVREKYVTANPEETRQSMPGAFDSALPEEKYIWTKAGFPRVQLPNGLITPGGGDMRTWKEGMPSMQSLGMTDRRS